MKNIYVKAYQNVNLGDDLFLKILFTRYPETNFYIMDCLEYKQIFRGFSNVYFIRHNWGRKFLDRLHRGINKYIFRAKNGFVHKIDYNFFDGFIYIGGSIFGDDFHAGFEKMHFQSLSYIIKNFSNINKKTFILGCNFETRYQDDFLDNYRKFFKQIDSQIDVCFRDKFSYGLFNDLSNVRMATDIVFSLKHDKKEIFSKSIGISIIDLENRIKLKTFENNYIYNIIELIKKAISEKYSVVLFSFCENEGDLKGIQKVMERLPQKYKEAIKIFNYDGNIEKMLDILSQMQSIIGTRFHSVILSQIFSQGILPVIYSDKTMNILKDIGLLDLYIDIRENKKIEDIDFLWNEMINNKISTEKLSMDSENHFKKLDEFLQQ